MSRRCELTGKKANNGFSISHSHRRTKRLQHVNLQDKLKISTKALKTIEKRGLAVMAKEAGLNLNKY
jgi:large subunit ribosomal protein L28